MNLSDVTLEKKKEDDISGKPEEVLFKFLEVL